MGFKLLKYSMEETLAILPFEVNSGGQASKAYFVLRRGET
jgi:hypothetical protein